MKISVSFLKSSYNFKETIKKIESSDADYIHIDVMDGLFVNNKTLFTENDLKILKEVNKPKEVHLMTLHLENYIDLFKKINPEVIIFSYEATAKPLEIINYLKKQKIKVGIAINPFTNILEIEPFLSKIDVVLLMCVIPGYGGQEFIKDTISKFLSLKKMRDEKKLSFLISVDGGINAETIQLFEGKLDIAVSGSYICTSSNYDEKIEKLKKAII